MKSNKKKLSLNIKGLVVSILSTLFILGGSLSIYYFSKGYRLDFSEREIRKTGVLTVQSEPSAANLYINDNSIGRTPRSRTLDVGTHNISVWRNGYREWKKNIEIVEEKSTPIYPFLILKEPVESTLWESEKPLVKYWVSKYKESFMFLQQENEDIYTLWQYRVNTPLWSLNPNPMQIITLETENIELNISPNGQIALLQMTNEEGTTNYILELQRSTTIEDLTPLDISDLQGYTITWAKDNRHLILESQEDIISLDITRNIRYLLQKKNDTNQYIWTTDEEGSFFILDPLHTQEDPTYTYALKQLNLDGTDPKYTIDKIYLQKDAKYAEHYRNNGDTYPEFKNSPTSTQTTGQIISIEVNQSAKGLFIKTETSTYWYNMEKDRYRMISPYPADLIQFSPDSKKLLFSNGDSIYIFTFDKEDANHTEEIGSKKIVNLPKNEVTEINWLSNSLYVYYIRNNSLFISEKDGENTQEIFNVNNKLLYSIKNSREHIITLEEEEETLSIHQYKIK
jgi:hypothetical protein